MKEAYLRLAVLTVLLANQSFLVIGWSPLPFSEVRIYEGLSSVVLVASAIYNWWKNNNVTNEAEQAQAYLVELKNKSKD